MAHAPLLQLSDLTLGFGGDPLFAGLDLVVQPGDRLALVGRNGSGKSTLLKLIAGLIEPDAGAKLLLPGSHVGYMEQAPDFTGFSSLGSFAAAGLGPAQEYRVDIAAKGLKFDPATTVTAASGGERRRAALARILAQAPELMLLDEPTNHLDIEAIAWLEAQLMETRAAFVVISHDRAFLRALARGTLWLDRGRLRRMDQGFDAFEAWRDAVWDEEDSTRHKLDRKIKAEARWAVEGISARRKRNQGRVRALGDLRAERAAMIRRQGAAAMAFDDAAVSGRKVIEAKEISKSYGDTLILRPFSLRILRGDRVALVGPNGVGKTTLLRILIGALEPDSGSVTLGTGLETVVFDQNRDALDPDLSLWQTLTGVSGAGGSGRSDQVLVRGVPRHVVGYLKDFLFSEAQARAPVRSLSGGEKARLLLAQIMAKSANLLVLDEPTNDLDIETLDLLQELVANFDGTVLLVSHDRDFLDRVATVTVAMEGDGRATVYAGGWSDFRAQQGNVGRAAPDGKPPTAAPKPVRPAKSAARKPGLSFTEKHRLQELPAVIEQLESEIEKLTALLSDTELFARDPAKFQKASEALAQRQAALTAAEDDWLMLEAKSEEI